jgi:hypothetical protein
VPLDDFEPPSPPGEPTIEVTVDPSRAVAVTRVRVRGLVAAEPPLEGDLAIFLVPGRGDPVQVCATRLTSSGRFDCRFRLGDLGRAIEPGDVELAVGSADAPLATLPFEVLPPNAEIVALEAVYQPMLWPLLQTIRVRNHGADPLDLAGWAIEDATRPTSRFVFPPGTIIDTGLTAALDFGGAIGAICPEPTARYFPWCSAAGDDRIGHDDEFWSGGEVRLVDPSGEVRATWSPVR